MHNVIVEEGNHRERLRHLLTTTQGLVRIASAYVTDTDLLPDARSREVRLLTALPTMDIISGATSLDSLRTLIDKGVQCRSLPDVPRFHAKVYIFGKECALVTSANLTRRALDSNIEVGVLVSGSEVNELTIWFDVCWKSATPLAAFDVSSLSQQTASFRNEYLLLRARCCPAVKPGTYSDRATKATPTKVGSSLCYFLCNTDRAHSKKLPSGEFELEELMRERRYATAWEEFRYPRHMKEVMRGDIIFMYANGAGIIAVGRARDRCESLRSGSPGRVFDGTDTTEWRIPVEWLVWVADKEAPPWKPHANPTFLNVSSDNYSDRRNVVLHDFFGAT